MNRNLLLILFVLSILLGGYAYYDTCIRVREAGKYGGGDRNFGLENVQEVWIKSKGQAIYLKKKKGRWTGHIPFNKVVGNEKIDDMLSVLNFSIVRIIEADSSCLTQYGLDHPEIKLSVKVKGKPGLKTFLIGYNNPTYTACYIKIEGQPEVLLAGILAKKYIANVLFDF